MTFSDGWGKRSAPSSGSFLDPAVTSKTDLCNQAYSQALGQIHGEMTKIDAAYQQCQRDANRLLRRSLHK
ncbi:hypothetical protein L596_003880 [Steinernema carpocapsae]|nr:hypothetical protein L596_003880 [Steinernema carpocapsae]